MLDGNQCAFVRLCQGYLTSFHSRWGDDTDHVNKEEERDSIADTKLAILSNKTGRYGVVKLMSRTQPKVTDYRWLSQCRPGDEEGSGRLRQGGGAGEHLGWADFY